MGFEPAARPLEADHFELQCARPALEHPADQFAESGAVRLGHERRHAVAAHLLERVGLDHPQAGRVHLQQRAIGGEQFHALRLGLKNGSQPRLALSQFAVGPFERGGFFRQMGQQRLGRDRRGRRDAPGGRRVDRFATAGGLDQLAQAPQQGFRGCGPGQEGVRAQFQRQLSVARIARGGGVEDERDAAQPGVAPPVAQQGEAVQHGQEQLGQHQVGRGLPGLEQRFGAVAGLFGRPAVGEQQVAQPGASLDLVVHEQHAGHGGLPGCRRWGLSTPGPGKKKTDFHACKWQG